MIKYKTPNKKFKPDNKILVSKELRNTEILIENLYLFNK